MTNEQHRASACDRSFQEALPAIKTNPRSDNAGPDRPIWVKAIAVEANRDERSVYYLLEEIDRRHECGAIWMTTPRRFRRSLGVEAASLIRPPYD